MTDNDEGARRGALRVPGAVLGYRLEGRGTPALVLGSSIYYPRTFSRRLRNALRLGFVDLRHFAPAAGAAPAADLARYLEDVERLRGVLGFRRCVLIGHSHHGNLALEYAKRYPRRVAQLVLIGTPPADVRSTQEAAQAYWDAVASPARARILQRRRAAAGAAPRGGQSVAEAFVRAYVTDAPKYWYDPHYDATPLWHGVPINDAALAGFRSFFADYRFGWDPAALPAPVLVVMGRHDYAVPPTLWDGVRPTLKNVTYRLLERSGHTPQLEEPERFDRLLLDWLSQPSVAGGGDR